MSRINVFFCTFERGCVGQSRSEASSDSKCD
jgi:hypothetical protein